MDKIILHVEQTDILDPGPDRQGRPTVFVSFLFHDTWSRQLRQELELRLGAIADLIDGEHIASGDWAGQIRRRMTKAKFMVADVTGPSREVMFEIGFAGNKELVLCAYDDDRRAKLPQWLTGLTIATYAGTDMAIFADKLATIVKRSKRPYIPPRLKGVPRTALWLQARDSAWADPIGTRMANLAHAQRVSWTRIEPSDLRSYDDMREYLSNQYVFVCLDGGEQDLAAHFLIGDLASRPEVGSTRKPARRAFVVTRSYESNDQWIADSVRRLPSSLVAIPGTEAGLFEIARSAFQAS